jgi:antitoxin StbD
MNEARRCLAATGRCFREHGADAEPVFFGSHRKPVGVMLSYEYFLRLLDQIDDRAITAEVQRRDAADDGARRPIEEVARDLGFDPSEVGLE